MGEPFDLAGALEEALSEHAFDVVHLHEPLAPSPALAALRHARGATAVTFHRAEPLAGVAFLRPLLDRALARTRLRIVTSAAARRALADILPGDYTLVAPGVDAAALRAAARGERARPGWCWSRAGRDRVGVRFALGLLRGLDLAALGRGDADRAGGRPLAHPRRGAEGAAGHGHRGPRRRARLAGGARSRRPHRRARRPHRRRRARSWPRPQAAGCAVLAPRCPGTEEGVAHGTDGLVLPPFTRDAWIAAVDQLVADPARRAALVGGRAGERRGRGTTRPPSWRREYRRRAGGGASPTRARPGCRADLRVRMGPASTPSGSSPPAARAASGWWPWPRRRASRPRWRPRGGAGGAPA